MIGIDLTDIKRTVEGGGDCSVFTGLYLQELGDPPVMGGLPVDQPVSLPDPMTFVSYYDPMLAAAFSEGGGDISADMFSADNGIVMAAVPPMGLNTGAYLEKLLEETKPDIVAVDERPFNLSAAMRYVFSLSCAAGLPAQAEITYVQNGQNYDTRNFIAGSMLETALLSCWQAGIPLFPLGPSGKPMQPEIYSQHGFLYDGYFWARWQSGLSKANLELDSNLGRGHSPGCQEDPAKGIGRRMMEGIGDELDRSLRESLRSESRYIASRIRDISVYNRQRGKKARILALVDISHYADLEQYVPLLFTEKSRDIYLSPDRDVQAGKMLITGRKRGTLSKDLAALVPPDSPARRLFRRRLSAYIQNIDREVLDEATVYRMIAEIGWRLRYHPDVAAGVSVRGTIAFEEVLRSFAQLGYSLSRQALFKAAMITLPPRLILKLKGDADSLIADIVKEVIYSFRYSAAGSYPDSSVLQDRWSADTILESLEKLGPLPAGQKEDVDRNGPPAVLSEAEKKLTNLEYLESIDFIKKDRQGKYSMTQKALKHMLSELERKFSAGEISRQEYDAQKARFTTLLENLTGARHMSGMTEKERANTIMEMLDAQDRGWNSGVNFNLMHLYYHVKQTGETADLSPHKRDYYALGRLIDDFANQQMLKKSGADKESHYVLTGLALDMLFKYLIKGKNSRSGLQGLKGEGKEPGGQRKQETRRYSSGDVFRDISVRHTLRTLAKQKKALCDIQRRDLRVYLKQPHRPQSDIVICIDTSGSMGFHHELIYARLVAAGIVQAAIKNRDRVGLVAFNDYGQIAVPLTERNADYLTDYIAGLSIRGNTNIGDGLKCASGILFRSRNSNQKYIILVTDGQPTAVSEKAFSRLKTLKDRDLSKESALIEARQAASRGAVISVIHIAGQKQDVNSFINDIARIGRGAVRRLSSAEDLRVVLH